MASFQLKIYEFYQDRKNMNWILTTPNVYLRAQKTWNFRSEMQTAYLKKSDDSHVYNCRNASSFFPYESKKK